MDLLPHTAILEVLKKSKSWRDISYVCSLNNTIREICMIHKNVIIAHVLFNKFGKNALSQDQYWEIGTNTETTQELVNLGVNINDDEMFHAAQLGLVDIIRIFHNNGGNIRAQDDHMLTIAARDGHINLVIYLLDNGADPRVNDPVENIIFQAIISGNIELVNYLHVQRNIYIPDGGLLIALAGFSTGLNMIEYLLQNGANPNIENSQALIEAVEIESDELVLLLIQYHVDVQARDNEAIIMASESANTEMLEILLENGANPNARDGIPLFNAVENERIDNVRLLLEHNAVVTRDAFVKSATGSVEIMQLLIEADNTMLEEHGYDAMITAIDEELRNIVRFLIQSGLPFHEDYLYEAVLSRSDSSTIVRTILTLYTNIPDEVLEHAIELAENEGNENISDYINSMFSESSVSN
jgi:ankyrin repeat protein